MNILICILVMALTTYLIRALPLVLLKKPIKSRFIRSFLHYVPTACLAAMTFPAILFATDNTASGIAGLAVGVVLAFFRRSLVTVAVASCGAALLVEVALKLL